MVKTRQSGEETKGRSSPVFLSLGTRRTRNGNQEEKNVDEDEESDDSSGVVHFAPKSYRIKKEGLSDYRHGGRSFRKMIIEEDDDDYSEGEQQADELSGKRLRNKNNNVGIRNNDGVRRSSRKKKLLYGTFDPKILERALYVDKQTYDGEDQPRKRKRSRDVEPCDVENEEDMYSRVKRKRKQIKRNMYGVPVENSDNENSGDETEDADEDENNSENENDSSSDDDDDDEEEEEEEEEDEDEKPQRRSYNLRENKPRTQWFEVSNFRERRPRKPAIFSETPSSPVRRRHKQVAYRSPAHKRSYTRKRSAFHVTSSTSSSEPGSSDDEEHFQKRKAKSMAKARSTMLPMNMDPADVASSTLMRDRIRAGASMADVDPMSIDRSVKFDSVGGLGKHIRALKEMIVFPLLYPEVFQKFRIEPPRGVLFYGPPGTGKTLMARALANECSVGQKRVAFFMRKGADCLSKWVGESERQLRLLFDQAYQMRPSIIFFDEIDGLCPVRSSRQDQIHSSIVSTILALMDGLDSRGEIVVIGATNRLDSIDPALRRPGRFDREFLFPLPSASARKQIIQIHTKSWNPKLCDSFVIEVAEKCVGYCGADLRSLCTEAALLALRRRYPQIYNSSEKLQLDVNSIVIGAKDFFRAMQNIVPASQRSVTSPGRALSKTVLPLLRKIFNHSLVILKGIFPTVLAQLSGLDLPAIQSQEQDENGDIASDDDLLSDEDEDGPSIFEPKDRRKKRSEHEKPFLDFQSYACRTPSTHRPRLLISGKEGQGQTSHLAPALLHHMEQLPVHVLDLPALFAVTAKTPEESCAQIFREARRTSPSIIYMPHVNQWWDVLGETLRATVLTLIQDLEPSSPILTVATSEIPHAQLDFQLSQLFSAYSGEVIQMVNPTEQERREFFTNLILNQTVKPPSSKAQAAMRMLEVLPKAPPPEPRKLTGRELQLLQEKEENTLRELRLFLRDVINKLVKDRKFLIFARPVDIDDVPDYYDIIKRPMDLSMMMSKIDMHQYQTAKQFMADIDLICSNALEYNPDRDPAGRVIRHRACALKDTAYALMKAELDPGFERQCEEILESKKLRGESPTKSAPDFYITRPQTNMSFERLDDSPKQRERFSRRVRGLQVEEERRIEEVEKRYNRRSRSTENSPDRKSPEKSPVLKGRRTLQLKLEKISTKTPTIVGESKNVNAQRSSSSSKPKKKVVWTYKKRRRRSKIKFASFPRQKQDDVADDDIEIETLEDNSDANEEEVYDNSCSDLRQVQMPHSCSPRERNVSSPRSRQEHDISPQSAAVSPGRLHAAAVSPRLNAAAVSTRHGPLHIDTDLDSIQQCRESSSPALSTGKRSSAPHKSLDRQTSSSSDKNSSSKSPRSQGEASSKSPRSQGEASSKSPRSQSESSSKSPWSQSESSSKSPRSHNDPPVLEPENLPGPSTPKDERPPTPKLVPVHMEVDSGISSNGDSVDSVEQMKQMASQNADQASENTSSNAKDMDTNSSAESPNFRVTRAKGTAKNQKLDGVAPVVKVDKQRLAKLLDSVVVATRDFNIEKLEKMYSMLSQCIYQYRNDYDKAQMIQDMEEMCHRSALW